MKKRKKLFLNEDKFKKKKKKGSFPKELDSPKGPGPWWCFMMVNLGNKPCVKKQTEIRCHSFPMMIKTMKNRMTAGMWEIIMTIGPFFNWRNAIRFCIMWCNKTRGQVPRMAKGISLWSKYGADEGYTLGYISQSKSESLRSLQEKKEKRKENESKFIVNRRCDPEITEAKYVNRYLMKSRGDLI